MPALAAAGAPGCLLDSAGVAFHRARRPVSEDALPYSTAGITICRCLLPGKLGTYGRQMLTSDDHSTRRLVVLILFDPAETFRQVVALFPRHQSHGQSRPLI
jgi:hypothetical protein